MPSVSSSATSQTIQRSLRQEGPATSAITLWAERPSAHDRPVANDHFERSRWQPCHHQAPGFPFCGTLHRANVQLPKGRKEGLAILPRRAWPSALQMLSALLMKKERMKRQTQDLTSSSNMGHSLLLKWLSCAGKPRPFAKKLVPSLGGRQVWLGSL